MNRTVVLLCYNNKEVLQYPNLQTWGPSIQSWLSCRLTEEKLRPTLVHNGAMKTSVTLFHIVCTEGRTIRQVFTKGIKIQMCRQLRAAKRIPAMKARGMARNTVRNLYITYLLISKRAWLQIHTLSKECVVTGSAITSSKPSLRCELSRWGSGLARVRELLGVGVLEAAVVAVGVVVHEELHVRLLRLQSHRGLGAQPLQPGWRGAAPGPRGLQFP